MTILTELNHNEILIGTKIRSIYTGKIGKIVYIELIKGRDEIINGRRNFYYIVDWPNSGPSKYIHLDEDGWNFSDAFEVIYD